MPLAAREGPTPGRKQRQARPLSFGETAVFLAPKTTGEEMEVQLAPGGKYRSLCSVSSSVK